MHDADFNALLEADRLEQALAVEEYVTVFRGEVRARFDRMMQEAMAESARALPEGWRTDTWEEWAGFYPTHLPWLGKYNVQVTATWDDPGDEEDVVFMRPFVSLYTPDVVARQVRDRLRAAVADVIPEAEESDHCPAWVRPKGYAATTAAEEMRALANDSGRALAEDMAATALRLVEALENTRWPRA